MLRFLIFFIAFASPSIADEWKDVREHLNNVCKHDFSCYNFELAAAKRIKERKVDQSNVQGCIVAFALTRKDVSTLYRFVEGCAK